MSLIAKTGGKAWCSDSSHKIWHIIHFKVHESEAGALVHVCTDGTVLVTHGGVEMGQGLQKAAQVAASAFNIPLSSVFVSETSTEKVPNASPIAASASSDMYGSTVLDACEQILARMELVASKHSFNTFAETYQLTVSTSFPILDLTGYLEKGMLLDTTNMELPLLKLR
ncbi:hypothetical protein Bca52824_017721 [Brassica carinata]|uniref:Aldehyde oxidase/xanthine dehydrogenase second molybdopterin binding domain-containing protein n=1 Tax=Brassica carinata TaxID=52824 RepID=A0A8X7VNR4_BRACI|nr:hypothetical protein Bca52824_017721 [Brassica carinata]